MFQYNIPELCRPLKATSFLYANFLVPSDPVMYLTFEKSSRDEIVEDNSPNRNNAVLENGAEVSPRILGR